MGVITIGEIGHDSTPTPAKNVQYMFTDSMREDSKLENIPYKVSLHKPLNLGMCKSFHYQRLQADF